MFILGLAGKHDEAARAQLPCLIGAGGRGGAGMGSWFVGRGEGGRASGSYLRRRRSRGRLAVGSTAAPSES